MIAAALAWAIRFLLPLLALPSCFDVQQVNPGDGTFLIDNFDDDDTVPHTPLFGRWQCLTFNPDLGQDPDQTVNCDLESPGDASPFGFYAAFKLHDGTLLNPDGTTAGTQYAGAYLVTNADNEAVDFTSHHSLVFDLRVDFAAPPPSGTGFDVQLGCNSVKPANDGNIGQQYFDLWHSASATPAWQRFSFPLKSFLQRQDELNHFADGPDSCLALVDGVRFEVNQPLTYGQSASGVLHIDDVHLE